MSVGFAIFVNYFKHFFISCLALITVVLCHYFISTTNNPDDDVTVGLL